MDIKDRFYQKLQESREQLDELNMSKKTYVSAMQRTTGYDADYSGEQGRVDSDKLIARAKKYKGKKFADQLAGADQMTERPNRNRVPGQWGADQLAWREPAKATKDGKANKSKLKGLKSSLTPGDYRKPRFPVRNLPEEQQLDELRKPKDLDKLKKHMKDTYKAAEDAAAKKYYKDYDDETAARKSFIKSKSPEAKEKADAAKKTREKSAKRVIKFQKINDKKQIDEVLDTKEKKEKYLKSAKADRDLAISDRDHYKKNLTDPERKWTKGLSIDNFKLAVDRNRRAMKRKKGIERAEKK